jgi:hypothetical protein
MQVLHVIKGQCSSPFVTKVKLVERTFDGDASVRFQMYAVAPTTLPAPLPHFVRGSDSELVTDEYELAYFLAESGAQTIMSGDGIQIDAVTNVLSTGPSVSKAVKLAAKSKTEEVRCLLRCRCE